MKKFVRMLSVVAIAVLMLACFAGCANDGAKTTDATAIKIGITGPLTGGAAIYGNAVNNAAKIAVEEINALNGIQFEFKCEDDVHDAEKAVNAYNALKDWNMQISLGSVTSTPGTATSAEANADHIFYLTPSASSTDVLGGVANAVTGAVDIARKDNVFQMCFMDPNQGEASAQYINDQKLGEKIAVIYKNDDNYSTGIYNSFKAKADELKLNIVSTTTFTDDTKTDFSVQVAAAKDAGADLIFLPMYYESAALILKEAKDIDYAPKFFGVDGMDGILGLKGFDTSLAEGVMLLTPFNADADDAKTKAFVDKYQQTYGEVPNQFAADAYDCIYAIYQALENGDALKNDDGTYNYAITATDLCDMLVEKFTAADFTYSGLTGENMTWSVDGTVSKTPKGMVIENGAYVGM